MENQAYDDVLAGFLATASQTPQFSPAHISLFVVIISEVRRQQRDPVALFARDLMKKSKIGGVATYHRVLKDLRELGFVHYEPSFNPLFGSLFYIKKCSV